MKIKNRQSPTDLAILQAIYDEYYSDFIEFDSQNKGKKARLTKNFVPMDCKVIASKLGVDNDLIFSRLYSYLGPKYSIPNKKISLFERQLGSDDKKHINFPLMASILAKLQNDEKRYKANLRTNKLLVIITLLAACAAIASALVAVFK